MIEQLEQKVVIKSNKKENKKNLNLKYVNITDAKSADVHTGT